MQLRNALWNKLDDVSAAGCTERRSTERQRLQGLLLFADGLPDDSLGTLYSYRNVKSLYKDQERDKCVSDMFVGSSYATKFADWISREIVETEIS